MVFNSRLLDTVWMFVCCCIPRKPAWFISLSGGLLGLLVLVGFWCGAKNWDLVVVPVQRCQCTLPSSTRVFQSM